MMFIEMTGKTLGLIISDDDLGLSDLKDIGVTEESIIRVNRQGDIELRRPDGWDVVGGLIGEYEARIRKATGLDWAE
ncbi:MAG: hypothetical protein NXI32_13970 [bacterium]|nr:hypothetical protein [bacterium]